MSKEKRLLELAREAVGFWHKLDAVYVDERIHYRLLDAKIGNLLVECMDIMGELEMLTEEMAHEN